LALKMIKLTKLKKKYIALSFIYISHYCTDENEQKVWYECE